MSTRILNYSEPSWLDFLATGLATTMSMMFQITTMLVFVALLSAMVLMGIDSLRSLMQRRRCELADVLDMYDHDEDGGPDRPSPGPGAAALRAPSSGKQQHQGRSCPNCKVFDQAAA